MWLKKWFLGSLTSCFRFYNNPPAAPAAPATGTVPKDPAVMSMDDWKSIIQIAVKDATKEEVASLKKEVNDVNRKSIFPFQDGTEMATASEDSIVDTGFFSKSYNPMSLNLSPQLAGQFPWLASGIALGKQLCKSGGPFKRLSKDMETFAKFIKVKADFNRAQTVGLDIRGHNESVLNHYKQAGMSEGVMANGGVFVPPEWSATVIEFAIQQSQLLQQVWRLPMNSNVLKIPRLVQAAGSYFGGVSFYTPSEGGEKESTHPIFEQLTAEAKKLVGIIYLTDELIADSIINVVNYITGLYVRAFQYEIERRIIAGLGTAVSGPCLGINVDPAVIVVPRTTAGTVGFQDIVNLDSALDENFSNLTWLMRKTTQNTVMTLRDTNNRPIFYTDFATMRSENGHPVSIWGYPVYRTRNLPKMGAVGDVILGDLSWYLLAMRQDMTIDQSEHVRFIYDELTLRFVMRFDGMPAISIAFAKLGDVQS